MQDVDLEGVGKVSDMSHVRHREKEAEKNVQEALEKEMGLKGRNRDRDDLWGTQLV